MNRKAKYFVSIVLVALALLSPYFLQAQGTISLEGLSEQVQNLFSGQEKLDSRVAAIETRLAPTATRTPRPTPTRKPTATPRPTRRPTPRPTSTLSPGAQAALNESAAYEWVNQAMQQLSREKGVDARKGGWMQWYDGQNMVNVFLFILDGCDLTGAELVALIEKYERDSIVVAMNKKYEPNLTNEVAIFRDLNRATGNDMLPCSKLIEQFKDLYKKE